MSPETFLIRVDGSDTIGMGHVLRCLYLVRELSSARAIEPVFIMKAFPMGVRWVTSQGYPVVSLPPDCPPDEEVERVLVEIQGRRPVCVLTDFRESTPELWRAVKSREILCVVVDEWGHQTVCADLLTNGTVVPSWHQYQLEGDIHTYIGPRYALMDRQFARVHELERPVRTGTLNVLIALGGDDPFFLTLKSLQALAHVRQTLFVTVVIGPAFTNHEDIRQAAARLPHPCEVCENTSNMAELMFQADVAITGGGLTALELACAGTPGLVLCEVDHQLDTAAALEQHGAAVNLGLGEAIGEEGIARALTALLQDAGRREAMGRAGKQLIDGQGCRRIAEAIVSHLERRCLR